MTRAPATAKVNLALVVGPMRNDGKHEVTTVLQRLALADRVEIGPAAGLTVEGDYEPARETERDGRRKATKPSLLSRRAKSRHLHLC